MVRILYGSEIRQTLVISVNFYPCAAPNVRTELFQCENYAETLSLCGRIFPIIKLETAGTVGQLMLGLSTVGGLFAYSSDPKSTGIGGYVNCGIFYRQL